MLLKSNICDFLDTLSCLADTLEHQDILLVCKDGKVTCGFLLMHILKSQGQFIINYNIREGVN